MEQEPKPKIGNFTAAVMLLVAVLFDLFQGIGTLFALAPTVVTQILAILITTPVSIFAYILFTLWFAFQDVSFFNIKKPGVFFGRVLSLLLESIPYLTALPLVTTNVLFSLIQANGTKGFPASLMPDFLLNITPIGKTAKRLISVAKSVAENENKKGQKDTAG